MKHTFGNSIKCYECKYYRDKTAEEISNRDGFCMIGFTSINGKKIKRKKVTTDEGASCDHWIDAEGGITAYEAVVGMPEPSRSELEKILIQQEIDKAKADQKAERDRYNERVQK